MTIANIPIFSMLRTRMQWHQERQRVLSENVANADTPRFKPRDLAELKFDGVPSGVTPVNLVRTNASHIAGVGLAADPFKTNSKQFEVRPSGNAVSLEDEMMKSAANQMDYQAATSLYTRSLGLLKIAIGTK